jgi:hypothetical protein
MGVFWEINKAPLSAAAHETPNVRAPAAPARVFWLEPAGMSAETTGPRLVGSLWCKQVQVVDFYRRST